MTRKEQPESCGVDGSVAANECLTEPVTRDVLMWLVGPGAWTLVDVAVPMSSSAVPASAQPRLTGQETPMEYSIRHGAGQGAGLLGLFQPK